MDRQNERKITLTRRDLAVLVFNKIGFSLSFSKEMVDFVFRTLVKQLKKNQKVKIAGFGNFVVQKKSSRLGRNPKTGEPLTIKAHKTLVFQPSVKFKAYVNKRKYNE